MKQVYRLFRRHKATLLLTLLCCIGTVSVTILWNSELAKIINGVQDGTGFGFEQIKGCVVLLLFGSVLQGGMYFFSAYLGEYAAHDLRMCLAHVTVKKPYSVIAKENAGEHISSQQNEMEEINQYISDNLFTLCFTMINFVFTLAFMLMRNAELTLLYTAPVIFLTLYTTMSSKVIYRYTRQEQEQVKKMNGVTGTLLLLFPVIRIYEAEKLLREKYCESIEAWKTASVAQERVKARLMTLSGMLACLPLVLLLLAGGTMVVQGTFSIGMLYVFVNLSSNVSGVLINLSTHQASFRRFCGNLDRVWESIGREGGSENEYPVARG